jgi:16S rRNA (guanine(527)-N(7))-methyltransferase RsmG
MFHVKHEGWGKGTHPLGFELDAIAAERLTLFERMLRTRAVPMGMIAASDAPRIRERHLLDSLRAVPLLPPSGSVCDLGSGAGLPGVALCIARPDLRYVLVEVRRTRAAFLNDVITALELDDVTVHPRRLETFRESVEVCTARAFASPWKTWLAAGRLLTKGRLIYWAGASFDTTTDMPEGVDAELFGSTGLARSGPLVIMTRT